MKPTDLLRRVIAVLDEHNVTYMVVGSMASMAYGEARLTMDIDVLVDLSAQQVDALCAAFPAPEYYISREAAHEAVRLRRQFNIINPASGMKVDLILARTDAWGRTQMARREKTRILPDCQGYIAAQEDVIIGKMDYYRKGGSEKHLRDIAGILKVGGKAVDLEYVAHWAEELGLKEIWEAIQKRVYAPPDEE